MGMGTLGTPSSWTGGVAPNHITALGNVPGDGSNAGRSRRDRKMKSMKTSDKEEIIMAKRSVRKLKEAMNHIKDAIENDDGHIKHEQAEITHNKSRYTAHEKKEVNREKKDLYGTHEVFAVPELHSYPLTKHGKPSRERVLAAWRYIHQGENASALGLGATRLAEKRIIAYAKTHFDLELHSGKKNKSRNPSRGDNTHIDGEVPTIPPGNEDSGQLENMKRSRTVREYIGKDPASGLDEDIVQIYGKSNIHDVIDELRLDLDNTANSRDVNTLQRREYITNVLARLSYALSGVQGGV